MVKESKFMVLLLTQIHPLIKKYRWSLRIKRKKLYYIGVYQTLL